MKKVVVMALFLLLISVFVGCNNGIDESSLPNEQNISEETSMMLRVSNESKVASTEFVVNDDRLIVTLSENPSTGYVWTYEIDKASIIIIQSDEYIDNQGAEELVGVGGAHKWIFKGISEGAAKITFFYMRSWENINMAIETREFNLEVI